MAPDSDTQPQTDRTLRERAQGHFEQVFLGNNSIDGTLRVLFFFLGFVLLFGSFFALIG